MLDDDRFAQLIHDRWLPTVRGIVAGRSLLYPKDGDVAGAVDTAVALLAEAKV